MTPERQIRCSTGRHTVYIAANPCCQELPMKKLWFLAFVLLSTLLLGQATSPHNAFTPAQITWGPPPPTLPPGAQMAVLEGDPGASSGDFTIRAKLPAGYKIAPHWHPKRENI